MPSGCRVRWASLRPVGRSRCAVEAARRLASCALFPPNPTRYALSLRSGERSQGFALLWFVLSLLSGLRSPSGFPLRFPLPLSRKSFPPSAKPFEMAKAFGFSAPPGQSGGRPCLPPPEAPLPPPRLRREPRRTLLSSPVFYSIVRWAAAVWAACLALAALDANAVQPIPSAALLIFVKYVKLS